MTKGTTSSSQLLKLVSLVLAAISLLAILWLLFGTLVGRLYDFLSGVIPLDNEISTTQPLYVGASGNSRNPARFFPQEKDASDSPSPFSAFTGLVAPKGNLTAPDIKNIPPFASVMPHMNNLELRAKLGNSAWHLLHTMANSYPKSPTADEKYAIVSFIRLLGVLYPCGECASHLREKLALHPPEPHVNSKDDLALYLCRLHNKVNLKLGHEIFDCSTVTERWKCGCGTAESDGEQSKPLNKIEAIIDPEDDDTLLLPDGTRRTVPDIEKPLIKERRSLFEVDYQTYVRRLIIAKKKNQSVAKYSTEKSHFASL